MITLTLLHPNKSVPLQHWTFDDQSVISIGRATDNNVILYSAVVSRRHIEIRRRGLTWELENLGTNGTFLAGKPVTKMVVVDGMIVRLASSGPQIQIRITSEPPQPQLSIENVQESSTDNEEQYTKETMAS